MGEKIRGYIFLIFGTFLIIFHFFYSPLPRGSLKRVKDEIKNLFLFLKIHREKVVINKRGREFFILSSGFNFARRFKRVMFGFDRNHYFFEEEEGIYIFIFKTEDSSLKVFKLKGDLKEFTEFINYNSDFLIFISIAGDASFLWDKEIEEKFKVLKMKENLKNRFGFSYIFLAKKEKDEFTPLYERISKDRAIYLLIKI